ncbi:MAG: CpaF family protein [Microbacteriaceae bacterium]
MVSTYLPGRAQAAQPEFALFGPLAPLLARETCTDVVVNGNEVWVDAGAGFEAVEVWFEQPVETLVRSLISAGGRHIDEVTPLADVRIGTVRVHAALPPVATHGPLLSLRIARPARYTLDELVRVGTLRSWQATALSEATANGVSVLISGATGSGKTTLLRALCATVPPSQRIITIEDVAELQVPHPHAVSLEVRQPNIEGAGAIGLVELVRAALRMRPDWLAVGECRGAEIREFLAALNTGHHGGGTIHANSIADVPARLEALGALAGLSEAALARQAASAFGLVVHLQRRGAERFAHLATLGLVDGVLQLELVGGDGDVDECVV